MDCLLSLNWEVRTAICLSPVKLCHYFGVTEGMMDGSEAVFG